MALTMHCKYDNAHGSFTNPTALAAHYREAHPGHVPTRHRPKAPPTRVSISDAALLGFVQWCQVNGRDLTDDAEVVRRVFNAYATSDGAAVVVVIPAQRA